jgi:hypothetical protein
MCWDQAFSNLEYEYVAGFVQSGSCLHANLHYAIVLSKNVIPFYPMVSQYDPLIRDHIGPIPWLPYGSKQYTCVDKISCLAESKIAMLILYHIIEMPLFFLQDPASFIPVGFGEPPPSWDPVCTPDFGMCIGSFLLFLAMIYEVSFIVSCLLALYFISCLLFCSISCLLYIWLLFFAKILHALL